MTKDKLFKSTEAGRNSKSDNTTNASRAIIDAEVSAREKKTERLRKLRLEQEAQAEIAGEAAEPVKKPSKKPAAKKAPAPRRAMTQRPR
ncbi:hypothetical protein EJC49_02525 [Aquibium carbonis]|uniref:Uncharacterized protein n=2 Tax=Aquibium carbonis TaxID=2495581 RepID=A0A429Z2Z5_9HYPH|nr:hypothetical protein EJC49_02525 [Aquibium carbonis]